MALELAVWLFVRDMHSRWRTYLNDQASSSPDDKIIGDDRRALLSRIMELQNFELSSNIKRITWKEDVR